MDLWGVPADLAVLLFVAGLCLVVGLPAIRAGVRLPSDLQLEPVADAELTPAQGEHFRRLDEEAARSHLAPLLSFRATNLQGSNVNRLYRSEVEPVALCASCLSSDPALGARQGQNYLEYETRHRDGTVLLTRSAELSTLFDALPHQVHQAFPGLHDVARLKARHLARAEALRSREPVFAHGRDMLHEAREHHVRWVAFQEQRGLLERLPDGQCRPTVRLALRGVAAYFNPLADNFTLPRFLAGLALGSLLPAGGVLLAPAVPVPALLEAFPAAFRLAVLGLAFGLGGAAVGWLFTGKCFVWSLALGYLPLRLLGEQGAFAGAALVLWQGWAADRVAAWRLRRQILG